MKNPASHSSEERIVLVRQDVQVSNKNVKLRDSRLLISKCFYPFRCFAV